MAAGQTAARWDVASFGPFRLLPAARLLERNGVPVPIGGRALDLLIALVEQAGDVVSSRDLLARVWPGVVVDPGTLRVQLTALRKALGDSPGGVRFIANVPGRGYCFVAPTQHVRSGRIDGTLAEALRTHNLPPPPTWVVGRELAVEALIKQLSAHRLVTVMGAGGIGKTTAAILAAHAMLDVYEGEVRFVELGTLSDPLLVASTVATVLGLPVQSQDPMPSILSFLREKRLLLVLDCCEHLIDAAAELCETVLSNAHGVRVLATSRESMRAEGEHLHRLDSLLCPPDVAGLTAAEVLEFPAAQLFVQRASATGERVPLGDANAAVVAEICRRLDGIPLAIELAASQVEKFGVRGVADQLDRRFRLLWQAPGVTLPRQRTLAATLDWSFNLLPEVERLVLRRLSVFVGPFTYEALQHVVIDERVEESALSEAIGDLVSKSLLVAIIGGPLTYYRVLDTTRAYLLDKPFAAEEARSLARRHADYYRKWLERAEAVALETSQSSGLAGHALSLDNVRAGLDWCFADDGDVEVGTALAAAAGPFYMALSLLTECQEWADRSIASLGEALRGTRREVELQYWSGLMLNFTKGCIPEVRTAYTRALSVADEIGDNLYRIRLFGALHIYLMRTRDFAAALAIAQRSEALANEIGDPAAIARANSLLAQVFHLLGQHVEAKRCCEAAMATTEFSGRVGLSSVVAANRGGDQVFMARILWLQGRHAAALDLATRTVDAAETLGLPVVFGVIISRLMPVFMQIGGPEVATPFAARLAAMAVQRQLPVYLAISTGLEGELQVVRGDAVAGMPLLRTCLQTLPEDRDETLTSMFLIALANGLAATGEWDEALATIGCAIARVERAGDLLELPEMQRVEAAILSGAGRSDAPQVEARLLGAIGLARRQSASFWELRAAIDLARLWRGQGRTRHATDLLGPVYSQFETTYLTPDLAAARRLLESDGDSVQSPKTGA